MIHVIHPLRRATILAAGQFDKAVIRAHLDRCLQILIELSGRRREFGEANSCISPPRTLGDSCEAISDLPKAHGEPPVGSLEHGDRAPSDSKYAIFTPLPRKFC